MEFRIAQQWDEAALGHAGIEIRLQPSPAGDAVVMEMNGPFFNDPSNPGGAVGKPFPNLWDYEVVEAFFLNDKDQYLEVEFCPHGQHLLLILEGRRNIIKGAGVKGELDVSYECTIEGSTWRGRAEIPAEYFPSGITKFNAYAIHGSGEQRQYEALYPAPAGKHHQPDFHRLEYFQPIDFKAILPSN